VYGVEKLLLAWIFWQKKGVRWRMCCSGRCGIAIDEKKEKDAEKVDAVLCKRNMGYRMHRYV